MPREWKCQVFLLGEPHLLYSVWSRKRTTQMDPSRGIFSHLRMSLLVLRLQAALSSDTASWDLWGRSSEVDKHPVSTLISENRQPPSDYFRMPSARLCYFGWLASTCSPQLALTCFICLSETLGLSGVQAMLRSRRWLCSHEGWQQRYFARRSYFQFF